jgi:hypothetical protein
MSGVSAFARIQWTATACAGQLPFARRHFRLDAHDLVFGSHVGQAKRRYFVHGVATNELGRA